MKDVYAYEFEGKLYINLTNRCTNDCEFCLRRGNEGVGGHYLWIVKEPDAKEVIEQFGELDKYQEVVFCGFGEPTIRLEVLKEVAAYLKKHNKKVRLDTNGLANLYYGRDITPDLEGLVDTVSISLNTSSPEKYEALCHPEFGISSFEGMLDFAKKAKEHIPEVIFSVVDTIGEEEIAKCRNIAQSLGVPLRVRYYIEPER